MPRSAATSRVAVRSVTRRRDRAARARRPARTSSTAADRAPPIDGVPTRSPLIDSARRRSALARRVDDPASAPRPVGVGRTARPATSAGRYSCGTQPSGVVVRIDVALAVAERWPRRGSCASRRWLGTGPAGGCHGRRPARPTARRLALFDLGASREVDDRVREVELASGIPTNSTARAAASATSERRRIGQADVLGREDHEAAGDVARVLTGFEHPREPVEPGVGIGAADALDERGDDVVVLVVAVAQRAQRERRLGVARA